MTADLTSEFAVDEIVESQGDVWLEERHPERAGLLVAVEMDVGYDDDLWETIVDLREGDVVEATLESQDDLDTVWHFSEIDVIRRSRLARAEGEVRGTRRRGRSRSP